jgi:hypothetical protein
MLDLDLRKVRQLHELGKKLKNVSDGGTISIAATYMKGGGDDAL